MKVSEVTTTFSHGLQVGDRLKLSGFSHRYRHFVDSVISATSMETRTYMRPSRGFARHLRKAKRYK